MTISSNNIYIYIKHWVNIVLMFFLFIAVYFFRVAHRANAINSAKAVESLLSLRLYMN